MEHHGVQPISPDVDDEARVQDINTKASEFLVNTVSLARREEPLLQETAHENTEAVVATEEEADFFSSDSDVIPLDSSMEVEGGVKEEVEGGVKEEVEKREVKEEEEVKEEVKSEMKEEAKEEVKEEAKGEVKEVVKEVKEEVKEEEKEATEENASQKNEQPIEPSLPPNPTEVPLAEALTYPTTQSQLALQDTEPECPPQPRVTRMVSSPATRTNPYSDTHERSPISPLFQTKRRNFVVNHPSIDTQHVQSRVWGVRVVCLSIGVQS